MYRDFFISTEAGYNKHADEIAKEPEVKIVKRIRCRGAAQEACVTRRGTIVGPLMTELVGFKELTPYRGGWCGNEVLAESFSHDVRNKARDMTFRFGEQLKKLGYRGYFELDFLRDLDSDELAVSLSFGGRKAVGDGFGIPIILRYILDICETTAEAEKVLARVPSHMSYKITLLDAEGRHRTVFVAPDRAPVITNKHLATNHQERVEWHEHAIVTGSVDRAHFLALRLDDPLETGDRFVSRFLEPPLYSTRFDHGWGTLYTAVYGPINRTAIYRWPSFQLRQSFSSFSEKTLKIQYHQI